MKKNMNMKIEGEGNVGFDKLVAFFKPSRKLFHFSWDYQKQFRIIFTLIYSFTIKTTRSGSCKKEFKNEESCGLVGCTYSYLLLQGCPMLSVVISYILTRWWICDSIGVIIRWLYKYFSLHLMSFSNFWKSLGAHQYYNRSIVRRVSQRFWIVCCSCSAWSSCRGMFS